MNIIKKDKFLRIINIIVVVIFIIHILVSVIETVEQKKQLVPTGNVDIFDINCNCQNCDEPIFKEDKDLLVYDKNGIFGVQKLRIFENPAYQFKNILAPGSENSYNFVIRNNNTFDINTNFYISETNKYNLKLKFRIKENNNYIVGNKNTWVTVEDLSFSNIIIKAKEYNTYSLDWKWEFSESSEQDQIDTEIGFDAEENYKLFININATRIEENQ